MKQENSITMVKSVKGRTFYFLGNDINGKHITEKEAIDGLNSEKYVLSGILENVDDDTIFKVLDKVKSEIKKPSDEDLQYRVCENSTIKTDINLYEFEKEEIIVLFGKCILKISDLIDQDESHSKRAYVVKDPFDVEKLQHYVDFSRAIVAYMEKEYDMNTNDIERHVHNKLIEEREQRRKGNKF